MSSKPLDIRRPSPQPSTGASPSPSTHSRHASIARLASPVPSSLRPPSPSIEQIPTPQQIAKDKETELPKIEGGQHLPGPSSSTLAAAIASIKDQPHVEKGVSSRPSDFSQPTGLGNYDRSERTQYGSFDQRSHKGAAPISQDPEIIKRHLVQSEGHAGLYGSPLRLSLQGTQPGQDDEEFSSLRLQGGDITRQVYRWAEDNEGSLRGRNQRSQSFHVSRPEPENEVLDIQNIKQPGGFRRNYLRRIAEDSPPPQSRSLIGGSQLNGSGEQRYTPKSKPSPLFTNNFLEFLTLHGHFAGEELEEDDEVLEPDEYFSSDAWDEGEGSDREPGEDSVLLTPGTRELRKRKRKERGRGTTSPVGAVLLLLKSFVGTGVLFLPRAYFNGGMLFSCLVLLGVASLSFFCFMLLINTRLKVEGSFGDIGGALYGKYMRATILFSIVLSQVGFVSAYTVFTAENLQAFILAVSKCNTYIDIKYLILIQLVVFLPLSLVRDIGKLGVTAFVADAFIMLGLIYLYYYDIATIVHQHGVADITLFNPSTWTLFIGTAIFTFEGVGMIIPIQESMARPDKFPGVLAFVTITITLLFTSVGALSYAAYGSQTETVVLLNMPQDDKFVNAVQFLYSVAILLSTPLQLFPAARIMENELFSRSGKYNPYIKWQKNIFRFFLVCVCSLIAWGGANDLDKFVSLVGSFACVPLVYMYPPLLHLKAVARTRWARALDWILFVFGVIGCVYTTALTVQQWASGPAVKSPPTCRI